MVYPGGTKSIGGPIGFGGPSGEGPMRKYVPLSVFFLHLQGQGEGGGEEDENEIYGKKKKDKKSKKGDSTKDGQKTKNKNPKNKAADSTQPGSGSDNAAVGPDGGGGPPAPGSSPMGTVSPGRQEWSEFEEGIAAYNRGSVNISRQIRRAYGDTSDDRAKPAPKPRPKDWGSKSQGKAEKWLRGYLAHMKSRGNDPGTKADLVHFMRDNVKIGKRAAETVVDKVLNEHVGTTRWATIADDEMDAVQDKLVAARKGRWGDRTNPFDPDGEPLRFHTQGEHVEKMLDLMDAGRRNARAMGISEDRIPAEGFVSLRDGQWYVNDAAYETREEALKVWHERHSSAAESVDRLTPTSSEKRALNVRWKKLPAPPGRPFETTGYETKTPMGKATVTKTKRGWVLKVGGKEYNLGRKADFDHAEGELLKLYRQTEGAQGGLGLVKSGATHSTTGATSSGNIATAPAPLGLTYSYQVKSNGRRKKKKSKKRRQKWAARLAAMARHSVG